MVCSNCRPISILPIFSKLIEKTMHKRVLSDHIPLQVDSLVMDIKIRKKYITLKHLISFLMDDTMRKLTISRAKGYVEVVKLVFLLFCMFPMCKAE